MKQCAFTGHRPKFLPWTYNENLISCMIFKKDLKNIIITEIKNGCNHFICGGAIGIDMICAEIIIQLKQKYKNVILEIAIPCSNQNEKWNKILKKRYINILDKCDIKTILCDKYEPDCMAKRNIYMVDKSQKVLAAFIGKPSGTKNTIDYARSKNKKIIIVNLNDYKF